MTQAGYNPFKCNWKREQSKAKGMTTKQLKHAIQDAQRALDAGVNPGKYKDQISVYRKELNKRD